MPVTLNSVLQVVIFLVVVLLITKPLGLYLTKFLQGNALGSRLFLFPLNGSFIGSLVLTQRKSKNGHLISLPC